MKTVLASPEFATNRPRLSLDGAWAFSYDPKNAGERDGWFKPEKKLPERIEVPGCSQVRHYESSRGNVRKTDVGIPEQSNTIMLKHGCMHPSWYQRRFTVPESWRGRAVHLRVGGVKPAADFWINGHKLGSTLTSRSPVRCDLTPFVRFGAENTVTVRIHWPKIRLDGMFDCLFAWSGIYRHVWVEAVPDVHMADIHAAGSINPRQVVVKTTLKSPARRSVSVRCSITDSAGKKLWAVAKDCILKAGETSVTVRVPMPGARLWNVDDPVLYKAVVRLQDGDTEVDKASVRFGLREIETRGFQVLLNGKPVFLRGGCNDHVYPRTVCPPADKAFHLDQVRKAKAYGFNYTKSACEVFTPEQLEAADELGYLVCQEMPFGMIGELRALRDNPPAELTALWRAELANIVTASRNHPSVVIYSMTSEAAINQDNPKPYRLFSRELPRIARRLDPGSLVIDVTAAYCMSSKAKHGPRDTDFLEDALEYCGGVTPFQGLLAIPSTVDRPFLLREWNWISGLPRLELIRRYKHLPLVPVQIPEMIKAARDNGQAAELPVMVDRSHKLKHVLRKDAHEVAYEHPKVAGFHGWLIHDIAYCPEGVFNEFWEIPKDLPAKEFRTYNNDTVLLLDDHDTRWFGYGEPVPLGIRIAHFGREPIDNAAVGWRLVSGGRELKRGMVRLGRIACGSRTPPRHMTIGKVNGRVPARTELVCELFNGRKRVAWNHWPLWFFPAPAGGLPGGTWSTQPLPEPFGGVSGPYDPLVPPTGARVFVTHRLTDGTGALMDGLVRFMEKGGRVLLLSSGALPEAESSFYRTVPFNCGRLGNMGTVVRPHAALGDFPHEGWCDLPFVPMIQGIYPMRLDTFKPAKIRPIIRSIGHHVTMEDKAYLFEVGVGKGALMACSLKLQATCHTDPAARYLLGCLLSYLASGNVRPRASISVDQLKAAVKAVRGVLPQ